MQFGDRSLQLVSEILNRAFVAWACGQAFFDETWNFVSIALQDLCSPTGVSGGGKEVYVLSRLKYNAANIKCLIRQIEAEFAVVLNGPFALKAFAADMTSQRPIAFDQTGGELKVLGYDRNHVADDLCADRITV